MHVRADSETKFVNGGPLKMAATVQISYRFAHSLKSIFFHNGTIINSQSLQRNCLSSGCRHISFSSLKMARNDHGLNATKIPDLNVKKSIEMIKEKLEKSDLNKVQSSLYVAAGQYYHTPKRDRVLVMHSSTNFLESKKADGHFSLGLQELLDCSLTSEDFDLLLKEINLLTKKWCHGEVNAVDVGDWTHGFILGQNFKIFSKTSLICDFTQSSLRASFDGLVEEIPLGDIKSVIVNLSEEPWDEQSLAIECADDEYTELLSYTIENETRDLATVMIDTEWTVKAAALLCLKVRKLGYNVGLKLPKVLTVQGNPWVENRHDMWTRFMTSI